MDWAERSSKNYVFSGMHPWTKGKEETSRAADAVVVMEFYSGETV
jgi:hypothetical protein